LFIDAGGKSVSEVDGLTPTKTGDERITYRGPIKKLLVSPEIGALIGAVLCGRSFGAMATSLAPLEAPQTF